MIELLWSNDVRTLARGNLSARRKTWRKSLRPKQIPHGLAWNWTWAS